MISSHTTSRELSERLKKLGVPQKSYFSWIFSKKGLNIKPTPTRRQKIQMDLLGIDVESAYLASELGEILKKCNKDIYAGLNCCAVYGDWEKTEAGKKRDYIYIDDKYTTSETEARGRLLEYLAKEGLIKFN